MLGNGGIGELDPGMAVEVHIDEPGDRYQIGIAWGQQPDAGSHSKTHQSGPFTGVDLQTVKHCSHRCLSDRMG